ncbi:uncharacterized protein LOC130648138 [Hydractinia symbiolongicarpus]|uniref:uncharacterized protein LOC130648138 n=1 Tax=Hydractinia symbiolongicarpus TaxID=13093 RepID=UPI00254CED77|nr:uncharacterized protein LOC130648138 [Hydractinia symbiolongicarpus]
MKLFDHEYFFKQFRMSPTRFEHLLSLIAPIITKCSLRREAISPSERLCLTLPYLVTGDSQVSIACSYRVSPTSITRIVAETCEALWTMLLREGYLKCPTTSEEWKKISQKFEELWNFLNCVGAIDGKHVMMQAPASSGSTFFNYKKHHSIVLLAVCNATYEFTLVDVGQSGRNSDGGVFLNSDLGTAINDQTLGIPNARILRGTQENFPYVFVGDEAFPLKRFMMKPYARSNLNSKKRICNYRFSRARRVIENCFGICASRFRIFRRPIIRKIETVVKITKAVVALHNYLMKHESASYCPSGYPDVEATNGITPGEWRSETTDCNGLLPIANQGSNNFSRSAAQIRDQFCRYFNSPAGSLSWQWDIVNTTADM